jgi:hypothetical protein
MNRQLEQKKAMLSKQTKEELGKTKVEFTAELKRRMEEAKQEFQEKKKYSDVR